LRALREASGRTQLEVELEASLGIGYLQRLERGKVQHPERETLERILAALGTSFAQRCNVLGLFGYAVPMSVPVQAECRWAIDLFQAEHDQACLPAYLLDCSHRLLAWNGLMGNVFGAFRYLPDDISIPKFIFDQTYGVTSSVLNAEAFFSAEVRILQFERQRWDDAIWYDTFIDDMRKYPTFDQYWTNYRNNDHEQVPLRPVAHLQLPISRGVADFRLISETFAQDPRFRVIYYLPVNAATMRQCVAWLG
jgi:transcriptional regulator with XRE-family HTH domain